MFKKLVLSVLLVTPVFGATVSKPDILRTPNSTSIPVICTVGDQYMDTDEILGQQFFLCTATNTWTRMGGQWDTIAKINAATTDADALTNDGTAQTISAAKTITEASGALVTIKPTDTGNTAAVLQGQSSTGVLRWKLFGNDTSAGAGRIQSWYANDGTTERDFIRSTGIANFYDGVLTGIPLITGSSLTATYLGSFNGAFANNNGTTVATTLALLPSSNGLMSISPLQTGDTTLFSDLNPATASAGKQTALVVDDRGGGRKMLTSAGEYPVATNGGALSDDGASLVPFVVQPRLDDATKPYKDADGNGVIDSGAINEWTAIKNVGYCSTTTATKCTENSECPGVETCTWDYGGNDPSDEWKNMPYGNNPWGTAGADKQWLHSGQCPVTGAIPSTAFACSGPHFWEARLPESGTWNHRPIVGIGSGGMAIYEPNHRNGYMKSLFTVFRGEDEYWSSAVYNTPLFAVTTFGTFIDGGMFNGGTLTFPVFTDNTYPAFNSWVQHDISATDAAFAVESSSANGDSFQQGLLMAVYDHTNTAGVSDTEHRPSQAGGPREAFGFYANSVMRLASQTANTGIERGQYIEWEGLVADANETRLRVIEPTADREIYLPNMGGTVVTAQGSASHGVVAWGVKTATDAAFDTGTEVCAGAGLSGCQTTFDVWGTPIACGTAHTSYDGWAALCK